MLFAIADLHLSISTGIQKSMEIFPGWEYYQARIETNWRAVVGDEDTVVIAGDFCWAMGIENALPDFQFLESLPGKKILLKGNHDYWWTTVRKMDGFLAANGLRSISFIHNNAQKVDGLCVCGTRGWYFDAERDEDKKIVLREAGRLERSILDAKKRGGDPVAFLHYPPVSQSSRVPEIFDVLKAQGITRCCYGHIHATKRFGHVDGAVEGVAFQLIAADYLDFTPIEIVDWKLLQ
ncbi:MAG: metallophosphoesterase [Oscillospiraceae bacterium]|jgi:predicted phosphohydrolase|nr:metallophosphoesterase [Oscillospiraceae bacterium]